MVYLDDIQAARDNLSAELKAETAARLLLVQAGNPPPTTYSVGGMSVDWNGYLATMMARLAELNQLIQAEDIYEIHTHGRT